MSKAIVLKIDDTTAARLGVTTADDVRARLFPRRAVRPTADQQRQVAELKARVEALEARVARSSRTSPAELRREAVRAGIEAAQFQIRRMRFREDNR